MTLLQSDLVNIPLPDESVDLIMSRSVFEHLEDPGAVYEEFHRLLKPGGHVVFLTANMWDYATLAARMIPNRYHPWIVARVEGRAEADVFPTCYRTNTRRDVERLCAASGLNLKEFRYLSQYPNYFLFNGVLFFLAMGYEKLVSRFEVLKGLRGWLLVTLEKPQGKAQAGVHA